MPAPSRTRLLRRAVALTGVLTLLLPAGALAGPLIPADPASPAAQDARTAYIVMLVIVSLLAVAAIASLLAAVRRSRGVEAPERRTRGTTGVQGRVGLALGVLVAATFVFAVVVSESARDATAAPGADEEAEELRIQATGHQWLWRYEYPGGAFSYHELVVPVDTTVVLDVDAIDVLHRWSVPALAPMADAAPGDVSTIAFRAEEEGTYEGRSTRFSGPGYAAMRTRVRVLPQAEYDAWLERQSTEIIEAQDAVQEEIDERVQTVDEPVDGDATGRELEPGPAEGEE